MSWSKNMSTPARSGGSQPQTVIARPLESQQADIMSDDYGRPHRRITLSRLQHLKAHRRGAAFDPSFTTGLLATGGVMQRNTVIARVAHMQGPLGCRVRRRQSSHCFDVPPLRL
jgi:hypothetical protein